MAYGSSEDSNQPGHPPSLIRVFFAVCIKKAWVLSYPLSAQWRLPSDWVDAQADMSLCWVHCHFVDFCHFSVTFSLMKDFGSLRVQTQQFLWHFYQGDQDSSQLCLKLKTEKNKTNMRPGKTQISLSIRPVWSESSLCAWRRFVSLATHWVHSEDPD